MNNKKLSQFQKLRDKILKDVDKATLKRVITNPKPTEEEIWVGAYQEMLEPQVADAIFEMNKKGYSTESSGFGGEKAELQIMDGNFSIDKNMKAKLSKMGVEYLDRNDLGMPGLPKVYHRIQFKPKNADIDAIKKQLDEIVAILPDKKMPTSPSISGGSQFFRHMLCPERDDVEKLALEKMLKYESMDPVFYRPAMEYRLKILNKS